MVRYLGIWKRTLGTWKVGNISAVVTLRVGTVRYKSRKAGANGTSVRIVRMSVGILSVSGYKRTI
jgi:hypothetical protein